MGLRALWVLLSEPFELPKDSKPAEQGALDAGADRIERFNACGQVWRLYPEVGLPGLVVCLHVIICMFFVCL